MKELFSNPAVLVPAIAWLVAQFLKFGTKAIKGDVSARYFFRSGNMPSAHTAVVVALLVTVAFVEGTASTLFGIALVLAMVVVYDAVNVRRAVGEQGTLLERLLQLQKDRINKTTPRGEKIDFVKVLGHTPLEVTAGAVVGLVTSLLLMHSYWSTGVTDYFWNYGETEKSIARMLLAIVALLSLAVYLALKRQRFYKLPSAKKLANRLAYGLLAPSLLGLFFIWANDVNLTIFGSKLALIIVVSLMVLASVTLVVPAGSNFWHQKDGELEELKRAKKQKRLKRRKR